VRFSHLVRAGIMPQSAYLGKQFLIRTLCSAARHPAHHCCSRGRNLSRPGRETAGFLRPRHGSLRPPPPSFTPGVYPDDVGRGAPDASAETILRDVTAFWRDL